MPRSAEHVRTQDSRLSGNSIHDSDMATELQAARGLYTTAPSMKDRNDSKASMLLLDGKILCIRGRQQDSL
jgi:hypothetical protein